MSAYRPKLVWVIGATVAIAGCASLMTRLGFRRDEIRSEHARHEKAKVDCAACHEAVYEAEDLTVDALPKEAKCLECHKKDKAEGQCGKCHTSPDAPRSYVRSETHLKMNHAKHIELTQENCATCHTKLPQGEALAGSSVPMSACLGCHEHEKEMAASQCSSCHLDLQRYGLKPITSFSHVGNYLQRHAQDAKAKSQSCNTCHQQSFCSDCHTQTVAALPEVLMPERVDRRFVHFRDYLTRHGTDALVGTTTCNLCHGTSFCSSCHTEQSLTPGSRTPLNPHPASFNTPGSPQFHGIAARRSIETCAACHDQGAQSNCVSCHRVGGVGGNPHPARWLTRHPPEEINRNAMCLACHL